jgi:tetratricopeptide (TPR) repeat protein
MCTARVSPSENIEDGGREQGQGRRDASDESDGVEGKDDAAVGQEHHLAANALRRQGQYKDAELRYLEARRIAQDVLVEGSEVVGDLSLNLGNMYGEMGKYKEALVEIEKGLQIMRSAKGERSMEAGSALHCIGGILLTQGNLEGALQRLLEARNILLEAVGPDHPLRRAVLQSLGSCYDRMGRPGDAGVARREASRIAKITEGDGPSDGEQAAKTLENLGHDFSDMGDLPNAMGTYEEALKEYCLVHGDSHPNAAYARNNIAGILVQRGQLQLALEQLETALTIKEDVLGEDHVGVAHVFKNVGTVFDRLGDHKQAKKMYKKSLAIFARALGRIDCYQIADVRDSLARSMALSCDLRGALENARESMRIYTKLGLNNQDSQATNGLLRMLEVNAALRCQ